MHVLYLGASVRQGLSNKDNSPYTIGEVTFATPAKSAVKSDPDGSKRWTFTAHGYTVRDIPLNPSALSKFQDVKPGTEVDLIVEPIPENPSRNHVVGVQ